MYGSVQTNQGKVDLSDLQCWSVYAVLWFSTDPMPYYKKKQIMLPFVYIQHIEIDNRDREIRPVQSATVLSDRGQAGSVAATGRDSTGVRQTPDGHWRQPRPLGWSFMGQWQAHVPSRDGCPRDGNGGGGVERDPLVALMLAGQLSQLRPGTTIRRRGATRFFGL